MRACVFQNSLQFTRFTHSLIGPPLPRVGCTQIALNIHVAYTRLPGGLDSFGRFMLPFQCTAVVWTIINERRPRDVSSSDSAPKPRTRGQSPWQRVSTSCVTCLSDVRGFCLARCTGTQRTLVPTDLRPGYRHPQAPSQGHQAKRGYIWVPVPTDRRPPGERGGPSTEKSQVCGL